MCFFMADGFYPTNNEILKFDEKEIDKILFNHYISRKENFQRLNGELERGHFKLSARTVAEDLGIPLTKAHKLIKEFEDLGIIKSIFKSKSKHHSSIYCYEAASNKNASETVETVSKTAKYDNTNDFNGIGETVKTVNQTVSKTVKHDNTNDFSTISETVSKTVNETSKKELLKRKYKKDNIVELRPTIHPFITDVINYLNTKANKNFKTNTVKTVKLIEKRLNEGYTLEQFKQVIDTKVATWQNDTTMNKYLRPETLFGEKFESYLNETPVTTNPTRNTNEPIITCKVISEPPKEYLEFKKMLDATL